MSSTEASKTSAPASSIVLKKMGATFVPKQIPPDRLLGTPGISSPKNQSTELVADFRDDPVPKTSPINVTGKLFDLISSIWIIGPISPGISGVNPSLSILNIANACRGMSGLDHASCAGERSSVLVSPLALKTIVLILLGTSLFFRNHSAFAHDSITDFARLLPSVAFSATS